MRPLNDTELVLLNRAGQNHRGFLNDTNVSGDVDHAATTLLQRRLMRMHSGSLRITKLGCETLGYHRKEYPNLS